MALTDKLKAIADAIRGKTGGTESLTLDQMVTEIAGIQSGGGNAAELIFETTFSVAESLVDANKTTVATIQTGLTQEVFEPGHDYYAVINCTNDTDTDFSYVHFKERTQTICDTGGSGYMTQGTQCGTCYYIKTDGTLVNNYASTWGLFISGVGKYLQSITLQATGSTTSTAWGVVCSGDYSLKLFKLNNAYFGVEGLGDD